MVKDIQGLSWVTGQLFELAEKKDWSREDKQRNSSLIAMRCAISEGASLDELRASELNESERRNGLPITKFSKSAPLTERHIQASVWRSYISARIERRDEVVGTLQNTHPDYFQGNAGAFAPRTWFAQVRAAMKAYDPLVNDDFCSVIETEHGRPLQLGYYDDTAIATVVAAENADLSASETDIQNKFAVDLHAFSYRTPMWRLSLESLTDLQGMASAMDLFGQFVASRMARGAGRDLLNGNGSSKPLGLLPSLLLLSGNCEAGVATGSSESTGNGAQTGANSIGFSDLNLLYNSVDEAWRMSPKSGWLCNQNTKQSIASLLDKYGRPLELVKTLGDGTEILFGRPIRISPSMPNIGAGNTPIIFGDLAQWCSRHAINDDRIALFFQSVGLIEKGECGLRCYEKWDGALLTNASSVTSPIKYLINHS